MCSSICYITTYDQVNNPLTDHNLRDLRHFYSPKPRERGLLHVRITANDEKLEKSGCHHRFDNVEECGSKFYLILVFYYIFVGIVKRSNVVTN